ncbi:hypothetical protein PPTG_20846 [Phytophthora nicotianae INRA-310]|uniref:Uncharacterized protein n=1 Tax=Phytophthora nicotianae (strain INRA-310) TaxID=761204 RepID=W2RHR6_PHYN3|nr:hypothetical protein PPTG_20846 [Phytophthora nicotianae INRA-310]ETN24927.1 hypothetical protein PPTG_20846 [Phytophthora nicotianae INRA-310]
MNRRPKNKNKVKLKGVEGSKANSVTTVAVQMGVNRSSIYRWRKQKPKLEGPRDMSDVFATYLHALPEAAVVDDASDVQDESFDE